MLKRRAECLLMLAFTSLPFSLSFLMLGPSGP